MTKLGRLLKWLILVPVLLVVALLSIANDHRVALRLNPFAPADPALQVDVALYQFGFAAFAAGALVGAFIVWTSQRKYRRKARIFTSVMWSISSTLFWKRWYPPCRAGIAWNCAVSGRSPSRTARRE